MSIWRNGWRVVAQRRNAAGSLDTEDLAVIPDCDDWRELYDQATRLAEADCGDELEVVAGMKWGSADNGPTVYARPVRLRGFYYSLTPVGDA